MITNDSEFSNLRKFLINCDNCPIVKTGSTLKFFFRIIGVPGAGINKRETMQTNNTEILAEMENAQTYFCCY